LKLVAREVGAEAGNRFQLVQRAARVASALPDIIGTTTPAAAANGATTRLVLSPTRQWNACPP